MSGALLRGSWGMPAPPPPWNIFNLEINLVQSGAKNNHPFWQECCLFHKTNVSFPETGLHFSLKSARSDDNKPTKFSDSRTSSKHVKHTEAERVSRTADDSGGQKSKQKQWFPSLKHQRLLLPLFSPPWLYRRCFWEPELLVADWERVTLLGDWPLALLSLCGRWLDGIRICCNDKLLPDLSLPSNWHKGKQVNLVSVANH